MRLLLAPVPQRVEALGAPRALPRDRTIVLTGDALGAGMAGARAFQSALERYAGVRWEIRAWSTLAEREGAVATIDAQATPRPESYHLTIGEERIGIVAHDAAGLFYAFMTLVQLARQYGRRLPQVHIEDWPDFPQRGLMLDVSRDKVPTMATLYGLIDMLAEWKLNQLQLYMEHTFAYERHRAVWKDASPFTGEEILALDAYCRERRIELVPNQNSFGHMARWLTKKPYNAFAEAPRGVKLPWGKLPPFTLDPSDARSIGLIEELYGELLPHFTSGMVNAGCDETFDLGRGKSARICEERGVGRVYLDFVLKIHKLCGRHGRRMMFWGDIVLQHPELIGEVPADVIALDWGYEHDHPYDIETAEFARAGRDFYVCPGAGGWNSFLGRTDNTIANIKNATEHGLRNGATGVLNTEWGDNGHMQPLPVAYLGMLYGAAMSWSPGASADMNVAAALSLHGFDDPSGAAGRVAYDLGNAYTINGARTRNGSLLQQLYFLPVENDWPMNRARPCGFTDTSEQIAATVERLGGATMRRGDAALVADELRCAAALADAGATIGATKQARMEGAGAAKLRAGWRRATKQVEGALPEFQRLWLARNRPGGLADSAGRLRDTAKMLRDAAS